MNLSAMMIGAASALLVDLQAYTAARSRDSEAKFDFVLCVCRMLIGAITGAVGGHLAGASL